MSPNYLRDNYTDLGTEAIAQLVTCLPSTHEVLALFCRHGGTPLLCQDLGVKAGKSQIQSRL